MVSFELRPHMLEALDDYHVKSLAMQRYHFEGNRAGLTEEEFKSHVDDDLVYHVPIYDMLDRKYASFCSLLEALKKGSDDPKGNGKFFKKPEMDLYSWCIFFYLFRLTGSGINYKPRENKDASPIGTHGFGNFWLVKAMLDGDYHVDSWYDRLKEMNEPFTDNKGYLLPQFSYAGLNKGHLKKFILEESADLVDVLLSFVEMDEPREIYEVVDHCNKYLQRRYFKRQNFVLTATAMDIAEYYPDLIDQMSRTYAGTNAKKCIRAIFKKVKKVSDFEFENDCMSFLADRYNTTPYSVEDSRACDVVRYIQEYQSPHHIAKNNGKVYKNNSVLKKLMGETDYYKFAGQLK